MKLIADQQVLKEVKKAGYTIEQHDHQLIIRRKFKVSLFFWAYSILLSLYLVINSPSPANITVGISILGVISLVYAHNIISYLLIDTKADSIIFTKGLLRLRRYANFSNVKWLELKTYDVVGSTSPFRKSNRDYIAEIRLIMTEGLPLELFSFEKDNPEDLRFSKTLFDALIQYTGYSPKIIQA